MGQGLGAGAGAAVAAVAIQAGWSLLRPSWKRAAARRVPVGVYLLAGAAAAAIGPWLVLVLLGCGIAELVIRHPAGPLTGAGPGPVPRRGIRPLALVMAPGAARAAGTAVAGGGLAALAWIAFKVGALSFGGGFVIIPLCVRTRWGGGG